MISIERADSLGASPERFNRRPGLYFAQRWWRSQRDCEILFSEEIDGLCRGAAAGLGVEEWGGVVYGVLNSDPAVGDIAVCDVAPIREHCWASAVGVVWSEDGSA